MNQDKRVQQSQNQYAMLQLSTEGCIFNTSAFRCRDFLYLVYRGGAV